ncbi:MAG: peptide deformylase, partial [Bacteroidales bacterium]|nr:peptide deformylase [Bacteroidales bacterium]
MKKIIFILLVPIILTSCASSKFTSYEKQIVEQTDNNGRLRVFLVENPSDSLILYKKSKNIKAKESNLALKKFTQDLYNTVLDPDNLGVGIAAPQVGINRKIIWVQRFDKEEKPYELFLNIEILDYSESKKEGKEGCLSVETYSGFVNRS